MGETRWASRVGMRAEGRGEGHFFFFGCCIFCVYFFIYLFTRVTYCA